MTLNLYFNKADNKALNKKDYLTQVGSAIAINLKRDFDEISPTLVVKLPNGVNSKDFNYAQIDGYYYFVEKKLHTIGGLWEITLDLDELYTFSTEIKNLYAQIIRCESKYGYNEMIEDSQVPLLASVEVETQQIGYFVPSTTSTYLCVVGAESET